MSELYFKEHYFKKGCWYAHGGFPMVPGNERIYVMYVHKVSILGHDKWGSATIEETMYSTHYSPRRQSARRAIINWIRVEFPVPDEVVPEFLAMNYGIMKE